ncbi:MAG: SAM-dependent methyltransferase, partial [Planctomycetes bacterium]|nr:SAM-dependent methyltransferase [Planctomycetota bacterium]
HGTPNVLLRGLVCVGCLLLPTMLMGATLPAIARWMETTRQGVARLGYFYGANIAGAVCGCLLAVFYLLRVHDVTIATYVAASINGGIAGIGWALARRSPYRRGIVGEAGRASRSPGAWSIYVAVAISGGCALGAEVVWTRQLSLLLGATVYTFSIILTVFLLGLGFGSSIGAALSRNIGNPRAGLGTCQLLAVVAVAWAAYQLAESLPYWPVDVTLPTPVWLGLQLDVVRCLWAIFPAALVWGASFPLALAAAASRGQDPGRLVGGLYAANTVGAIVGALGFSLVVIAWLGTQRAQQLLIAGAACSALLVFTVLAAEAWQRGSTGARSRGPNASRRRMITAGAVVLTALCGLLVLVVPETPPALIAYGRNLPTWHELPAFVYRAEGMNASLAVSRFDDDTRNFHVSGKVVASSNLQDMRLQRMLGHIPALIHPAPKSVLVVGCGAGVTAGSFLVHPTVERIVVCEIEPLIPAAATAHFGTENYRLLDDPRVVVVCDDARHYVTTTSERFDIITSDPIHPWVRGAAALYSREYFEACRQRLTDDGIVTQWVPLYETNFASVQTELATFFTVFPTGSVWSNDQWGEGYDIVLLGQRQETVVDADELQTRLDRGDHRAVVDSLAEVGIGDALGLLTRYAVRAADLGPWLEGAAINGDRNLRLQYLAGRGLNRYEADVIFATMVAFRRYPLDMFPVNGRLGRALRFALENPGQTD